MSAPASSSPKSPVSPSDSGEKLALFEHQVRAKEWAKQRETTPHRGAKGGIFDMKMGLGKTVVGMEIMEGQRNLCVVPKPLMDVWKDHFTRFHPEYKVIYFHKEHMSASRYNNMTFAEMTSANVVVTTYEVVQGVDRKHKFAESERVSVFGEGLMEGKVVEVRCCRALTEQTTVRGEDLIYAIQWRRVVMDEGHKIVNYKTKIFKAMMAVYGTYRWVLTGTPIRNKDTDLWSLLRFVGYTGCPSARGWDEGVYFREKLNSLMFSMDYQEAKVELPPKHIHNITYTFSPNEQRAYDTVKRRVVAAYNGMMLGQTNFMYVLAMFTRLRQMCIAPHLITPEAKRKYRPTDTPTDEQARQELDTATQGLETWIHDNEGTAGMQSSKLRAVKEVLENIPADEKVIIFSCYTSALDLIEDMCAKDYHATRAGEPQIPVVVTPAANEHHPRLANQKVAQEEDAKFIGPRDNPERRMANELQASLEGSGDFDDLPEAERQSLIQQRVEQAVPAVSKIAPFTMVMLDGDCNLTQRRQAVKHFMEDPECRVLLAHNRAAGEGLTLTRSNHVIQLEPWWSPAVPAQNFSRVHRPPQTRECHQYNLLAESSIETEMVMAICQEKDTMKSRFLGEEAAAASSTPVNSRTSGMTKELMGQILGVRR